VRHAIDEGADQQADQCAGVACLQLAEQLDQFAPQSGLLQLQPDPEVLQPAWFGRGLGSGRQSRQALGRRRADGQQEEQQRQPP